MNWSKLDIIGIFVVNWSLTKVNIAYGFVVRLVVIT